MEKINVAELLRNCPKGMELYSPLCGKCVFDRLNMGTIICKKQNTQEITFTSEGCYMLPVFDDCECMIFPSKDQRDWSKFQRPFKDGDVVTSVFQGVVQGTGIFDYEEQSEAWIHVCINLNNEFFTDGYLGHVYDLRLATEEEKQKLFQAIKENGYKWNAETKTLEKLPMFKVGDKIRNLKTNKEHIITHMDNLSYYVDKSHFSIWISEQDEYELVPNKFDITTLKAFDEVLVRDYDDCPWGCDYFSHIGTDEISPYVCTGLSTWRYCIPYNDDTKHLLGTTDDCKEYFKTWK